MSGPAQVAVHVVLSNKSVSTLTPNRLVGLVVNASASRMEDPGSNPTGDEIFPGRVIQVT